MLCTPLLPVEIIFFKYNGKPCILYRYFILFDYPLLTCRYRFYSEVWNDCSISGLKEIVICIVLMCRLYFSSLQTAVTVFLISCRYFIIKKSVVSQQKLFLFHKSAYRSNWQIIIERLFTIRLISASCWNNRMPHSIIY